MCPRRRFYIGPINKVAAGKKKRVLFHKGKICVKELLLRYDGNDDTSSKYNVWSIKIDGEEIINRSFGDIYKYLCGYSTCQHSDRPIVCNVYNTTINVYSLIFHDLGLVEDGIEVWFENKDTSNDCDVSLSLVYDVLE